MSDSEVFREVDEDYRRERAIIFWRRYGSWVAGAFIAAMLAVAGGNYWYQQQQAKKAAQTADLEQLLAEIKPGFEIQAADGLALYASRAKSSLAALALFSEASLRQRAGAPDDAARIYHQIADGAAYDADLRDLAVVRLGYIAADQTKPEPIIPLLQAIADKDSPWRYSAREAIALLTARAGQREAAAKLFSDLAGDRGAPPDLVERARALADFYRGK
jgi:hypothetical protein